MQNEKQYVMIKYVNDVYCVHVIQINFKKDQMWP